MSLEFYTEQKVSFKSEGEVKTFLDNESSKKFFVHKPALQEMLKEVFQSTSNNIRNIELYKIMNPRNATYVSKYKIIFFVL